MSIRSMMRFAVILALLPVLLFSAAQADSASYSPMDDTLTVSLSSCVAGNEYVLFLLEEGANWQNISPETILYMNQYPASGSAMEILHVSPDFQVCEVAVAGVFTDNGTSPRHLGTVSLSRHSLQLPSALRTIEAEAFSGGVFTHVFLGEKVTSIGSRAFSSCASLVYIYIPASVTNIAADAFTGSDNVVIHCTMGSPAHHYAIEHEMAFKLIMD